jgi:exodeoxyribonuclease VII large subunit
MQARLPVVGTPHVLSVTALTSQIRDALDAGFGAVWVEGEISNARRPPSGHVYFTLKDERSQIAAVMFRRTAQSLPFDLEDGAEVIVRGRLGLYAPRGDLQLYVETVEPKGLGALQLAFEQLKARLAAEGLFAEERKRPLPFLPRRIGVVTALGGAAIHDILITLKRRAPAVDVRIRPVRVQGVGAGTEIAAAIADMNAYGGVEVLIVGRGGGSLEDLWAFNEEVVARAIVASAVPVVSAVGHEIDVTISDFVADCRAPTPTAAAQMVVPDSRVLAARIAAQLTALRAGMLGRLDDEKRRVRELARELGDPRRRLDEERVRLDHLWHRARRAIAERTRRARGELGRAALHLEQLAPRRRLEMLRARVAGVRARLVVAMRAVVERQRSRVERGGAELQSLSPLAVLERGYALVWRAGNGALVREAATLRPGERLRIRLASGEAWARVDSPGSDDRAGARPRGRRAKE